jgi:hypothetical protein
LAVNGRAVSLYEIGTESVHYFSPSLSGALPSPQTHAWAEAVHREDRDWLLGLHQQALEAGKGYEVMFRYSLPDGRLLWVVDRQEKLEGVEGRRASGISIDVTDLVTSTPKGKVPAPLSMEVLIVAHPRSERSATSDLAVAGRSALPFGSEAYAAWVDMVGDRASGSLILPRNDGERWDAPLLISWAPLGDGRPHQLLALAVARVGAHLTTSRARRNHLAELASSFKGTLLHLTPGGRARVRREWLTQLDPLLESYSDLLDRSHPREVQQLRAARRSAMEGLESYCAVLSCDLGSRQTRLVEIGLPNAAGTEWDCLLVALDEHDATNQLRVLREAAEESQRDPRGQLLRVLLNDETQSRVLELLLRVDGHEAHIRRKLAMLGDMGDPVQLARGFSHALS